MKDKTPQKQREQSLLKVLWIGFRDKPFTKKQLDHLIHADFQQQAHELLKTISKVKSRYNTTVKITAEGYQLTQIQKEK